MPFLERSRNDEFCYRGLRKRGRGRHDSGRADVGRVPVAEVHERRVLLARAEAQAVPGRVDSSAAVAAAAAST